MLKCSIIQLKVLSSFDFDRNKITQSMKSIYTIEFLSNKIPVQGYSIIIGVTEPRSLKVISSWMDLKPIY